MASPNDSPSPPTDAAAVIVLVSGRVQGVGFRYFIFRAGVAGGLTGWVRNLENGTVEARAEGSRASIERWLLALKKGPSLSLVENLAVTWLGPTHGFAHFAVVD